MTAPLSDATRAQNTAAHPARSTWVSANAGSGKTRVLTDRVARLLLKKVLPQKILCLTYTKAAAAEMQARLFKRLGAWSMLEDDALRAALTDIGEKGESFTPDALNTARTLFARALETPGGLKIQTIHAFCGQLLRRFPLEAGVSPQFSEIDETQAAALQNAVLADMAEAMPSPLDTLALHLTNEAGLDKLLADVLKHREDFARFDRRDLARLLDVATDLTPEHALAELQTYITRDTITRIAAAIAQSGTANETSKKWAPVLQMPAQPDPQSYLDILRGCFLNKNESRPANPVTKGVQQAHPWIMDSIIEVQDAILASLDRLRACRFLTRSTDLASFAQDFLARYAAAKSARNALDFDDLIDRTRDLLTSYETTQWVLYRLDGGIEHILVDEAQDTSPRQWEVIDALSLGFSDQPPGTRTIFVVGDHKQSIFGFQGAEPGQLAEKQEELADRLAAVNDALQVQPLEYSFRSAAPILSLVDRVFANDPIGALNGTPRHLAFGYKPGRVDVWPFKFKEDAPEEQEWWRPIDMERPADPVITLADELATHIRDLLAQNTAIPDGGSGWRAATPGDFLILVRSRNRFFHRLIAQLKSNEVPVAGADRLRIKDELAVKDLLSLLRFLDNERDDLSLAEALRSPVFSISEADLFGLAHARDGLLWQALRTSEHKDATALLTTLRDRVDYDRPFEILESVLTRHGARARLVARLGSQCTEAIDELLSQALVYEQTGLPTLSGFLAWIDARNIEIKRDMDASGGEVRVMTIHGAKGLEAPIVVLADTSQRQAHQNAPHVMASYGLPFWTTASADTPQAIRDVEDNRRLTENRETARLLYVALTRAESWLIVCGAGDKPEAEGRWFGMVEAAAKTESQATNPMEGPRIEAGWCPDPVPPTPKSASIVADIEALRLRPVAFERIKSINPSRTDEPHSLAGIPAEDCSDDALDRGTFIHTLLDALSGISVDQREAAAQRFRTGADWQDDAIAEALACLTNLDFAPLFTRDALAEVSISARPAGYDGQEIFGRIDRLLVSETHVLAVDFKSNRHVPTREADIPAAIRTQMNHYAAALAEVYPHHHIETAIAWTATGVFMPLSHAPVT